MSSWVRRSLSVVSAASLLVLGATNVAAPASAATVAGASPSAAAPPASGKKPGADGPKVRGVEADRTTQVVGTYAGGRATFTVTGAKGHRYDVAVSSSGAAAPGRSASSLTLGGTGKATLVVPVTVGAARSGSVTATLTTRGTHASQTSGTVWLSPTSDGGVAQGASQQAALVDAIRRDEPTRAERQAAYDALGRIDTGKVKLTRQASSLAAASGRYTITGTATYDDWNGTAHPARHIKVYVEDRGFFGGTLATTTTDDSGDFTLEADIDSDTDLRVHLMSESSTARVGAPAFLSFDVYGQYFDIDNADPGSSAWDVSLSRNDAWGNAFVIHDALWSAHLFAVHLGHGEEDRVDTKYPAGSSNSTAFANGDGITLGANEWSAWDVVNHEYGHWYDGRHSLLNHISGSNDHCVSANLASNNCGLDPNSYGKSDGTTLAWTEGFADYYALAAGRLAAHPTITGVGDGYYDDERHTEAGAADPDSFAVQSDGSNPSRFHGEDNEFSVSGVLWSLASAGADPIGAPYLDTLLVGADSSRLSDLLGYAWESDSSSRLLGGEELSLACALSNAEIAPHDISTPATSTTQGELSKAPEIRWLPGNTADSGTTYPNDSFVVQAVDASGHPYFSSSTITQPNAGGDWVWTPTGAQWSTIVGSRDDVSIRVVGTSTSSPTTGPYRGCAQTISVEPGALVNEAACVTTPLPANDDGSTAGVDLPFPVSFFGTTYSYLYVNNNGNVTFNAPLGTYTPFTLDANTPPIIAPFFADVDTRGGGSAPVRYGYGTTTYNGRQAFCVDWVNVGYYAGHDDKLNSFQLLLVDRSDTGAGDFDIVFNYGHILWETGDASSGVNGFGGSSAAVGFSAGNGQAGSFYQKPGSLQPGSFLDSATTALIKGQENSSVAGRYLHRVRNGAAGNSGTGIRGTVTGDGFPLAGAPVQVCPHAGGTCVFQTRTGADGRYAALGVAPGTYDVRALPPTGTTYRPRTVASVVVVDQQVTTADVELQAIDGVPAGTTLGPLVGSGGIPMVNWNDNLTLRTTGCAGGTASYEIISTEGASIGSSWASGSMTDTGDGHYVASIPPLSPHHGPAEVLIVIVCPDGSTQTVVFDIYIDPSGTVVDQDGRPVPDATVTLLRSDDPQAPFEVVPDGSDLMSPANRRNPMTTGATGAFGWDVVAGYYRVTATADGCSTAQTDVLTIPPPVTGLRLVLTCERRDVQPPVLSIVDQRLEGNTTGGWHGSLPGVTVSDPDTPTADVVLVSDAPDLLPLGATTVTWTATDPAGNTATGRQVVTVVDTTAPAITCPADVSRTYTRTPAIGQPAVADVVDAAPSVAGNAPTSWPLGTTVVTWTARDHSGNASTCAQRVTLLQPWTSTVSAGDDHTLAVLADGTVRGWGAGGSGQLGRGTTTDATSPVAVPGLTGIRAVAAGGQYSVALGSDGVVYAWGANSVGQLGDGTTTGRTRPAAVTGLPPILAVAAGRTHVAALGLDGSVWAWGSNASGQVGVSGPSKVLTPTRVAGVSDATEVAAGEFHTLALRSGGTVLAWGGGAAGQLGDGTTSLSRATPRAVSALAGVVHIGAGAEHSLAVTSSGAVFAWGANAKGQLGDGTTTARSVPVRMSLAASAVRVAGGDTHSLVLAGDGSVWSVGRNNEGQLGDGTRTDRLAPVRATVSAAAGLVAAGRSFSVAGLAGGTVQAWGTNRSGQIGDGTTTRRQAPVTATGITGVAQPS